MRGLGRRCRPRQVRLQPDPRNNPTYTYESLKHPSLFSYRAVDQHGQVIDVLVSERRDAPAARAFVIRALMSAPSPVEVTPTVRRCTPG